jgi:hypothetical protein
MNQMSDDIQLLPVNKMEALDAAEAARLRPYLAGGADDDARKPFLQRHKRALLLGLAFMILSVPFVTSVLNGITGNSYLTLLLKVVLFAIAMLVIAKV